MRVVAGELRGRRLKRPPGARPTADRVREAIFSILGAVEGMRVLDLFAGSGALGIEALSRGASEAVFVERDARAAAVVRSNLADLGLEASVQARDALGFLRDPGGGAPFDLVFCDPPYDLATRLGPKLAERLPPLLCDDSLIVTESDKRAPLELPFPVERRRAYGDTLIVVHRGG